MRETAVYLDHAATTLPEAEVLEAMAQAQRAAYNPSALYEGAGEAARLVRRARRQVAAMLGADPAEVYFTSGGTESNSWALFQAAGRHVVLSAQEHASVIRAAQAFGCAVTLVQPDREGVIHPEAVAAALRPDTALVSVQAANNETGVLQPVHEIYAAAREHRVLFHCDAVQAFGHVPLERSPWDLVSVSAHKVYGPKGVGCLAVRQTVALRPMISGGGQEMGMRAGTENVPAICGFEAASSLAAADMAARAERERTLTDMLTARLRQSVPGLRLLGAGAARLPGIAALLLPGLDAEEAIARLDGMGVWLSGGAACAAREKAPSPVYTAMGLTEKEARQVLRISVGRHTTPDDMEKAARAIAQVYASRTAMSDR